MIDLIKRAHDDNIGRKMALEQIVDQVKQDPEKILKFSASEYAQALHMIITHSEEIVKIISGFHFGLTEALELIEDGQVSAGIDLMKKVHEDPLEHAVELYDPTEPCCEGCAEGEDCESDDISLVEKVSQISNQDPDYSFLRDPNIKQAEKLSDLFSDIKPEPWKYSSDNKSNPPASPRWLRTVDEHGNVIKKLIGG